MLRDGCAIVQKQIANIGQVNFDAFAWLLAVSAALFVWGLALLMWSIRVAKQGL